MSQTLDALPIDLHEHITCAYRNPTSSIQVIRISNIQGWYFEKVVFPGQIVLLETLPTAQLEIYVGSEGCAALLRCESCSHLQIIMKSDDLQARATV